MSHGANKLRAQPSPSIMTLSADVVERIAAGEVIERPASVVRELIENALDAGASSIRIEVREGGIRLIRVGDDGEGIRASELALAIAPHATSKVRQSADIERVTTLGFRGEALASIAAVAPLRLVSTQDDHGLAATITVSPNAEPDYGFESRPCGTTVTVRDLFQTIPARRSMLLGPRGEERLVLATIRSYALAHPAIQFIAIADGKVLLQTPGNGIEGAVRAIYGTDIARGLLLLGPEPIEGGTLSGWIAPRAFTLADRTHIHLCVNGRPVRNRTLLASLESGYRPLLRKGRHPIMMAALYLDAALIDVNIHPTKAEVLICDERTYAMSLRMAIYQRLGQAPAQPPPALSRPAALYGTVRQYPLRLGRRRHGTHLAEPRPLYASSSHSDSSERTDRSLPPLEPLGQLDNALIIAATPEGDLFLIDQHRAHERLLYEELCRNAAPASFQNAPGEALPERSNTQQGQLLLEPLVVELSPRQALMLASRIDELAVLGLACEPFGGSTFLVRALPALPGAANNPAAYANDLAADAAEDAPDWREHLSISLACRAALRRGQPLSISEQRSLLAELRTAEVSASCPHGSPIVLRYTHGFLAHLFEW